MEVKKCSRCNIIKELSEYHTFKRSKDGRVSACKLCISLHNKKDDVRKKRNDSRVKWILLNPDKNRENKKRHYLKHRFAWVFFRR